MVWYIPPTSRRQDSRGRAGFVTTAAGKGIPFDRIMRQTRHKNERVLMTYIRPATIFRHNPTEGLGDEEDEK